jgi:hypothetical protein
MSCVDLAYISNEECIGNSLSSINGNFAALSSAVCDLSANSPFNIVDSPTVDLDWNASTRTLSANANYLLTLINQLSTNMTTIEPTSTWRGTGVMTNVVAVTATAVLRGISVDMVTTGSVDLTIKDGTTIKWSARKDGNAASEAGQITSFLGFTPFGIKFDTNINVTSNNSNAVVYLYYNLL